MIPEKLYIPTSTLNFSSILTSESISPKSFYEGRNFGHKRFEKVAPNDLDNRILLYAAYPIFEINDDKNDNYPLVIEIDTRNQLAIKEDNGFFYSDKTLYFNPFSTRFIFRNEKERKNSFVRIEPFQEPKMFILYEDKCILKEKIACVEWKQIEVKDAEKTDDESIEQDRKIDSIKGFLYGYWLGVYFSLSKPVVTLKKYHKEISDILSAIVQTGGKKTNEQENTLNKYYIDFNYHIIDPSLFGNIGLSGWQRQIERFNIYPFDCEKGMSELNVYLDGLDKKIDYVTKKNILKLEDFPIFENLNLIKIPNQDNEVLIKLLNEYFNNQNNFENSRYDFVLESGKFLKNFIPNWENSEYREYLNKLIKNVKNYEPFDINSSNDFILKSFACFCQKGEKDINKLENHLIKTEIGDFSVAFGLWGAIFGFANISKTLTNKLFSEAPNYLSKAYKFIHKQIHNIDLSEEGSFSIGEEIPSKINDEKHCMTNDDESNKVYRVISQLFESKKKPNWNKESVVEKYDKFKLSEPFFIEIGKIGVSKTDIKTIKKELGFLEQNKKKQHTKNESTSTLPDERLFPIGQTFYNDPNVYVHLEKKLPKEKKIREQFKEDLDWFQNNFKEKYRDKKGNYSQGMYKDNSKENKDVISHFENYCLQKKDQSKKESLKEIYSKIDIEKIVAKLKELYKIE